MPTFLLSWTNRDPSDADLASIRSSVRVKEHARLISLDGRRHLMLLADGPHPRAREHLAAIVRERRPDADVHICAYPLAGVLEGMGVHDARAFVDEQLARLAAHDREHGTDLLRVLELALDHHDRNAAARAAFMHRNTFRRRLRKALELVDADLDCPEERLALHLALKMRALTRAS